FPTKLPFIKGKPGQAIWFRTSFVVPDSADGQAGLLAVTVDRQATVFCGDSTLGQINGRGELVLSPKLRARQKCELVLKCWNEENPTRLLGVWFVSRPQTHLRLQALEAETGALRGLPTMPVGTWKAALGDHPGAEKPEFDDSKWKTVKPDFRWQGRNTVAWVRGYVSRPQRFHGFSVADDSLWLDFGVDDTADVYMNGKRVAHGSGSLLLTLPPDFKSGKEVFIAARIVNFGGHGHFRHALLVSKNLTQLQAHANEFLDALRRCRTFLERVPQSNTGLIANFQTAVEKARKAVEKPGDFATAVRRLDEAQQALKPIEKELRVYPVYWCGPYLQNVGPDSITVMWETLVPSDGVVHVREKGTERFQKISADGKSKLHEVRIRDLKPDTDYEYWVQSGSLRSKLYHFHTAPDKVRPFRFAVWGDSRTDPFAHRMVVLQMARAKPEFAVNVGDVVGHGANWPSWALQYFLPMGDFAATVPTYISIGNHEYGGYGYGHRVQTFEYYVDQPGNEYYFSFNYAGSHFIVLDPNSPKDHDVPPGSPQYKWLLDDLNSEASQKANWRFVFFHEPPYSENWDLGGYYDGEELLREHVVPLLEKYHVTMVFSGHTHDYERGQWPKGNGPYYVITGGGGARLDDLKYKEWPQIDKTAFAYHFCILDVTPDSVDYRAVLPDGSTLDEVVIRK
ncbi:MAG TPA: metallophosphoesterase family protein, partial [Bacteroidetes bacterium]|nr:metallophosphoesterase family protein [Bacteroidota bacterium]